LTRRLASLTSSTIALHFFFDSSSQDNISCKSMVLGGVAARWSHSANPSCAGSWWSFRHFFLVCSGDFQEIRCIFLTSPPERVWFSKTGFFSELCGVVFPYAPGKLKAPRRHMPGRAQPRHALENIPRGERDMRWDDLVVLCNGVM
jgi:hypothetical protein